jgi:hypothetical protein
MGGGGVQRRAGNRPLLSGREGAPADQVATATAGAFRDVPRPKGGDPRGRDPPLRIPR